MPSHSPGSFSCFHTPSRPHAAPDGVSRHTPHAHYGSADGHIYRERPWGYCRPSLFLLALFVLQLLRGSLIEFCLHGVEVMRVLFFLVGMSLGCGTLLGTSVRLLAVTPRW